MVISHSAFHLQRGKISQTNSQNYVIDDFMCYFAHCNLDIYEMREAQE